MKNEQLALVLEGISFRFAAAIDESRLAIAETRPSKEERVHDHPQCNGLFCQNGDHFSPCPVPDPVDELAPLDTAAQWLEDMIATLRTK